ncbi:MAG: hypothetical protein ACI8ZN_000548 [Bacteroidia bacterium]|jgi:hypothetical protein
MFTLDSVLLKISPDFKTKEETQKILGKLTMDELIEEFSYESVMS